MTNNGTDMSKLLGVSTELPSCKYDGEYTKTAQFMLPAIDLSLRMVSLRNHFVNAFVDDERFEHDYKCPIFILLSTSDYHALSWLEISNILHSNTHFKHEYYVGEENGKNLLMFVFQIPEKYEKDYYHFLNGKYSKFCDEYKALFPKNSGVVSSTSKGVTNSESVIWGALYKSEHLKQRIKVLFDLDDATADSLEEYYDIPHMEREIFNHSTKEDEPKKE